MGTIEEFNEAYWASFPAPVRALRPLLVDLNNGRQTMDEVHEKAFELALAGYTVDPDVMRYGTTPYFETKRRIDHGYAWVPAFLEEKNYDAAPGVTMLAPDWRPYNPSTPTKRYIKASLDLKDWPPADAPVVAPVRDVPAKPNFAISFTSTKRAILVGDSSPAGTPYEGVEGKWVKVVAPPPFSSAYWEAVK